MYRVSSLEQNAQCFLIQNIALHEFHALREQSNRWRVSREGSNFPTVRHKPMHYRWANRSSRAGDGHHAFGQYSARRFDKQRLQTVDDLLTRETTRYPLSATKSHQLALVRRHARHLRCLSTESPRL